MWWLHLQEMHEVNKNINSPGELGEGVLGLIFARYMPLASQNPYPIIVCSVARL